MLIIIMQKSLVVNFEILDHFNIQSIIYKSSVVVVIKFLLEIRNQYKIATISQHPRRLNVHKRL